MEPIKYTLSSTGLFFVPGMLNWLRALTKRDVKGARTDVGARKKMLSAWYPALPAAAMEKLLAGDYVVDGEDVIVTV